MSNNKVCNSNKIETAELDKPKLDEFKDFAYIVSHDLKKPLRAISNYAQFLSEDYTGKFSDDADRMLKNLIDLSRKSQELIDQIYDYACIDQVNINNEVIDLNILLPEIVTSISDIQADKNISINIIGILPSISCNRTKLTELFYNIILNAVVYNDKSQKNIEISYNQDSKVFVIKDNGIGIEAKHLDKIFKLFKRIYNKNINHDGSGVGLTMARKIVEYYGGKIWVESELNHGTCVYFTLGQKIK